MSDDETLALTELPDNDLKTASALEGCPGTYLETIETFRASLNQMEKLHEDRLALMADQQAVELRKLSGKSESYMMKCAQLSDHMMDVLKPELRTYRERFGRLPDFPAWDSNEAAQYNPTNSIAFWKNKVDALENQLREIDNIQYEEEVVWQNDVNAESRKRSLSPDGTHTTARGTKLSRARKAGRRFSRRNDVIDTAEQFSHSTKPADEGPPFQCHVCGHETKTARGISNHIKMKH